MYIEDVLHLFVDSIDVEPAKEHILVSISRQIKRGNALTDRQYALVKSKLLENQHHFDQFEFDVEDAVKNTRLPLRVIDRTKEIKIVSHSEMLGPNSVYEAYKDKWQWIKIRFPFNKKDISKVESVANLAQRGEYHHIKGSHEHYFMLTEKLVFGIVNEFKETKFTIDQDILDIYEQLLEFNRTYDQYLPGVYDYGLCNVRDVVKDTLYQQLGEPSVDNLLLYKDRSLMYALQIFDDVELAKSSSRFSNLAVQIAMRTSGNLLVDKSTRNLQSVIDAMIELERFPILIVCDEALAEHQLISTHQILRNRVLDSEISVMFRLDGDHEFNQYVKEKSLNNYVDKSTKVVYINKSKMSKPLIRADWTFNSVLMLSSDRTNTKLSTWIDGCDLIISHDTEVSSFGYLRSYNNNDRIEKIT